MVKKDEEGLLAQLNSSLQDGLHQITIPLTSDGALKIQESKEELTLNTPWLKPELSAKMHDQAIRDLDDPRLSRIAEAAQAGFHLPPESLGQGWEPSLEGDKQVWQTSQTEGGYVFAAPRRDPAERDEILGSKLSEQRIILDPRALFGEPESSKKRPAHSPPAKRGARKAPLFAGVAMDSRDVLRPGQRPGTSTAVR